MIPSIPIDPDIDNVVEEEARGAARERIPGRQGREESDIPADTEQAVREEDVTSRDQPTTSDDIIPRT